MPYIADQSRRQAIRAGDCPRTAGELNFAFSDIAERYIRRLGVSYQILNDLVGALENAKHELQRRIQDPYEDQAIKRNGDLYERILTEAGDLLGFPASSITNSQKGGSTRERAAP